MVIGLIVTVMITTAASFRNSFRHGSHQFTEFGDFAGEALGGDKIAGQLAFIQRRFHCRFPLLCEDVRS